jgi:N-acetylmuramoyl-L-alanine amidase
VIPARALLAGFAAGLLLLAGCRTPPGKPVKRHGDEIVVAGQLFRTGTPVVTWMDPGGYDAYRVERRFSALEDAGWEKTREQAPGVRTPNRYGLRRGGLAPEGLERVRGGGWDLDTLRGVVDQFVLHYDVCGTSRACFNVLHDHRGLSVHFLLDVDGTLYQTLDLKERAWHATTSNDRSVGIEIANMGAYPHGETAVLDRWYGKDEAGATVLRIPESPIGTGVRTEGFVGRPDRPEPMSGVVQGQELVQYDLTPQQYEALIRLTAALCTVFPKIRCDYPRDAEGRLVTVKLPDEELARYQGVIGHFHIQANKVDPGPALQWDRLIDEARRLMR